MAGVQVKIAFDDRRMRRDFKKLRNVDQLRATAQALNATRSKVRTDLKQRMVKRIPIQTSAKSRKSLSRNLLPKRGKANVRKQVAVALQLFKYVPKIWMFPAGMKPQGIGNGEFIQVMPNGYVGVFKQKGTGTTKAGKPRITQVLVDKSDISERQLDQALKTAGNVTFPLEFRRSAIRYINKGSGRGR